jgi:Uma2 family endonuclease
MSNFAFDDHYRVRPDVLFLVHARAVSLNMTRVPVPGAPDLAAGIISPSERSADTQEKLQGYLRYGTQEVWLVYPKSKSVVIHRQDKERVATSAILDTGERIETSLLPGFSLDVKTLFQ